MLKQLNLPNVTVISLNEFEDEDLLRVKPTRNKVEYCWTCTGSTIKYCIERYQLDHCTYIKADLFFFCDPDMIVRELYEAGKDVLITRHNFSKKYEPILKIAGVYCAQFMVFRNTAQGMAVLNWWRNACIEWCYDRSEDGKYGHQKYLDDWTSRFPCVHECTLPGAGIAPWNATDYDVVEQSNCEFPVQLVHCKKRLGSELFFYRFHKFRMLEKKVIWVIGYRLPKKFMKHIYIPYTKSYLENFQWLRSLNQNIGYPPGSRWLPSNFLTKTMFFFLNIPYRLWKEKQFIIEFNNYHVYQIKNGNLVKS
jgi:hypothetical protein